MGLNFLLQDGDRERYVAIGGRAWPHQWRFEIERHRPDLWLIAIAVHVPGQGFVVKNGGSPRQSLEAAKCFCDDFNALRRGVRRSSG